MKYKNFISTIKEIFIGGDINCCYEFVLMDEETRTKLVEFVKPSQFEVQSYLNFNVAFGVRDIKRKIFLTLSRHEGFRWNNDGTGIISVDTYVVITENEIFNAVCTQESGREEFNIPNGRENIVIPAIKHYSNMKERDAFEKRLAEKEDGFSLIKLNSKYNFEMIESLKKKNESENTDVTENSLKKNYKINSEKEAREFLIATGCNPYVIKKHYNQETIDNFEKYASGDNKYRWVKQEYVRILSEIADGNVDDFENKLNKAKFICNYWINDDPCEDLIFKACQTIFDKVELVPRSFERITAFIYLYHNRFVERAEKIEPLLDLIDGYLKKHSKQRYGNLGRPLSTDNYKNDSMLLRGVIAERSRAENTYAFEFIITDNESIDRILSMCSKVHDSTEEFNSEVVEDLNFSYGAKDRDGKIFLTGLTYGANSIQHYKSFYLIRFVIIIGEERNVLILDCRRDTTDGSIRIVRPYETAIPIPRDFDEYREILTQMIIFYRSKPERDNFERKVKEQNPEFNLNTSIHNIPKTIYEKYKDKLETSCNFFL